MYRLIATAFGLAAGCLTAAGSDLCADFTTFRAPSGGTEVEISLKLSTDSLGVLTTEEGPRASVSFSVTVQDSTGTPLLSDRWERILAPPPDSAGHDVYFLDSSTLEMPPGAYRFTITAVDRARDRSSDVDQNIMIPAYAAPGIMLSDMLVSGSIPQQEEQGQFVREGYRVVPSPDRCFGATGSMLYVYQEIYNLAPRTVLSDSFDLTYRLVDQAGREVRAFRTRGMRGEGDRAVKISGLSIAGIPAGRYDLESRADDPETGLHVSTRHSLQVVTPKMRTQPPALGPEQIEKSRDLLAYLASSRDRSLFESLDPTGQENFVTRFWAQRDPDPGTPGNPYFDEMMRRYAYANEYFASHEPGWRTDRGRVYIMYGPPRDIDRNISNPGTRDHEIWTYAIEGQSRFIFVDERGYGEFRLVHSTMRGEIENPQWEELLRPVDDER